MFLIHICAPILRGGQIRLNAFILSCIYSPGRDLGSILNERVGGDGGDDDRSAEDGIVGGLFADEQEDPDGIKQRFDEADDRGVEWSRAAGDASDKQNIRESDLDDA